MRETRLAVAREFRAWMDSTSARWESRAFLGAHYADCYGWAAHLAARRKVYGL